MERHARFMLQGASERPRILKQHDDVSLVIIQLQAPLPVCEPATANPSFSRLYWTRENKSVSSSINTIFFIA